MRRNMKAGFFMLSAIALLLGVAGTAHAAPDPGTDPQRRGAEIAAPSVVLIQYQIRGYLNDNRDGQTHGPYGYSAIGTGFFISDDGYIATAAHVAAPSDDDIKAQLVEQYLADDASHDSCQQDGTCQQKIDSFRQDYLLATSLTGAQKAIKVFTQDMNAASGDTTGLTAELKASSPTTNRDTAVIKVTMTDSPAIQFADSAKVQTQDDLSVIGYPGDTLQAVNAQTALVPTITRGTVTAKAQGDPSIGIAGDVNVFHTDAASTHGNSGGPAVDVNGNVIGLVSFGSTATTTNSTFLITSNDIRDVVKQSGADVTPGQIDKLWRDGLSNEDKHYYKKAQADFQQCAALNKVQIGCTAQAATAAGLLPKDREQADLAAAKSKQGSSFPWLIVAIVGAAVILLAAVGGFLIKRRSSGKAAPPAGRPVYGAPNGPYLPTPNGGQAGSWERPAPMLSGFPTQRTPELGAPQPLSPTPPGPPPAAVDIQRLSGPPPVPGVGRLGAVQPDAAPLATLPKVGPETPMPRTAPEGAPVQPEGAAVHEVGAAPVAHRFCGNCGSSLNGAKFCPSCGTRA